MGDASFSSSTLLSLGGQGGGGSSSACTGSSYTSSSTFPALSPGRAALVERIVQNVEPPTASEWKPLLQAYESVFEGENRLDERDEVYGLILKLGVQRGRDWKSKWEAVKHEQGLAVQKEPQREQYDYRTPKQRTYEGTKDRVVAVQQQDTRPGYTAVQHKGAADTDDIETPIRSHLPVHASGQFQGKLLTKEALLELQSRASPYKHQLPPRNGILALTNQTTHHARPREAQTDVFSQVAPRNTPGPSVHFAPTPLQASTVSADTSTSTHHSQIPINGSYTVPLSHYREDQYGAMSGGVKYTAELKQALLARAEKFHTLTLMGRMFDEWGARLDVLQRIAEQTDLARNALLQRRMLQTWVQVLHAQKERQEGVATAYEVTQKRKWLLRWKGKLEAKKRKEWEHAVSKAFRYLVRRKEQETKSEVFTIWRTKSLEMRADRYRRTSLLRGGMTVWLSRSAQIAELDVEADAFLSQGEDKLKYQVLSEWRVKASLQRRERVFDVSMEERLKESAFWFWMRMTSDKRRAEEVYQQKTVTKAFSRWRSRLRFVKSMQSRALALAQARQVDTLDAFFHLWHIKEHGRLLLHARNTRLARSSLLTWQRHTTHIRYTLSASCDTFIKQHKTSLLQTCFARWSSRTTKQREALQIAGALAERLTLQKTFKQWRQNLSAKRLEMRKAVVANQFFVQRGAILVWVQKLRSKKVADWISKRDAKVVGQAFAEWRERARQSRSDNQLVAAFQQITSSRLLARSLSHWTERVIFLRARLYDIAYTRKRTTLSSSLARWRARLSAVREMDSLVVSFKQLQGDAAMKRSIRKWAASAERNRDLRERLESWEEEGQRALVRGVWERWRDRWRERGLVEQEEQLLTFRQERALVIHFQRWKANTMTLPAIRFNNHRLRKTFLNEWLERLPLKVDLNKAVVHDRQRLLGLTFTVWEEARRTKAARRAANRFRSFASIGSTPPTGSNIRVTPPALRHRPIMTGTPTRFSSSVALSRDLQIPPRRGRPASALAHTPVTSQPSARNEPASTPRPRSRSRAAALAAADSTAPLLARAGRTEKGMPASSSAPDLRAPLHTDDDEDEPGMQNTPTQVSGRPVQSQQLRERRQSRGAISASSLRKELAAVASTSAPQGITPSRPASRLASIAQAAVHSSSSESEADDDGSSTSASAVTANATRSETGLFQLSGRYSHGAVARRNSTSATSEPAPTATGRAKSGARREGLHVEYPEEADAARGKRRKKRGGGEEQVFEESVFREMRERLRAIGLGQKG